MGTGANSDSCYFGPPTAALHWGIQGENERGTGVRRPPLFTIMLCGSMCSGIRTGLRVCIAVIDSTGRS
jgi:hypothetical protein